MSNKLCPYCGEEPQPRGTRWVICVTESCPNRASVFTPEQWNRRFVCLDKNGDKVYAGDRVKTPDYKGKVDCLGGICIESEDGHLHHVWPSEIELVKKA